MKKYWTLFKANLQISGEYRFDMAIWGLSGTVTPFLGLAIWLSALKNNNLSYSQADLVTYFLMVAMVNILTSAWGAWFINEEIVNGGFAKYLIKPLSSFENNLMENLSEKVLKLFVVLPVILVIGHWMLKPQILNFNFLTVVLFILTVFNAFLIAILIDQIIGLSGFWFHDVSFANTLLLMMKELFTGILIPVAFLPGILHQLAIYMPFRYLVSFPVEVLLNKLSPYDLGVGFLIQFMWVIMAIICYKLVFQFGSKYYQGYGG